MADDNAADDLGGGDLGGDSGAPKKGGGLKGALPALLKWILIALAAVIFIVTVVFITVKLVVGKGNSQTAIPVGVEFTTAREDYDWYSSLDQVSTQTSDVPPASVMVRVVLGYKKDDKQAASEITARRVEIIDFLRRYFSTKTVEDLRPENEEVLKQQIRDQINDDILSNARIRSVMFTEKNVVTQ